MAPRKAAKKAQASAAIQQDLDTEEEFMGEQAMVDQLQGMASRLDIMITIILGLSDKVNGQKKVPAEQMDSQTTSLLKSRPEGRRSR